MEKLRKVLQALLIGWGLISFVGVVIWGLIFFSDGDPDLREGGPGKTDRMTAHDVRFILNTEPLQSAKLERIVHSFESARAFTGDHRDAVALKVTELPIAQFDKLTDRLHGSWVRGDKIDAIVKSALSTGRIRDWQPIDEDVLTADYFINPRTLVLHDGNLTAAELIYVNLKTEMVYYISFKF